MTPLQKYKTAVENFIWASTFKPDREEQEILDQALPEIKNQLKGNNITESQVFLGSFGVATRIDKGLLEAMYFGAAHLEKQYGINVCSEIEQLRNKPLSVYMACQIVSTFEQVRVPGSNEDRPLDQNERRAAVLLFGARSINSIVNNFFVEKPSEEKPIQLTPPTNQSPSEVTNARQTLIAQVEAMRTLYAQMQMTVATHFSKPLVVEGVQAEQYMTMKQQILTQLSEIENKMAAMEATLAALGNDVTETTVPLPATPIEAADETDEPLPKKVKLSEGAEADQAA